MPRGSARTASATARIPLLWVSLSALCGGTARGHGVVVTTGELRAVEDRLELTLHFSPHDLQHRRLDGGDSGAVGAFLAHATEQLIVFDDAGQRVPSVTCSASQRRNAPAPAGPSYEVVRAWRVHQASEWLTLQLAAGAGNAFPNWQIHLRLLRGAAEEATLSLGARGNIEVLNWRALRSDPPSTDRSLHLTPESFVLGRIELRPAADFVEVRWVLPVALLDQWSLMPAAADDAIDPAVVATAGGPCLDWIRANVELQVNGQTGRLALATPQLITPAGAVAASPCCRASARVEIRGRLQVADYEQVRLAWRGFNAGVLRYDGRVYGPSGGVRATDLTPYSAALTWTRTESP